MGLGAGAGLTQLVTTPTGTTAKAKAERAALEQAVGTSLLGAAETFGLVKKPIPVPGLPVGGTGAVTRVTATPFYEGSSAAPLGGADDFDLQDAINRIFGRQPAGLPAPVEEEYGPPLPENYYEDLALAERVEAERLAAEVREETVNRFYWPGAERRDLTDHYLRLNELGLMKLLRDASGGVRRVRTLVSCR
jgi:hypothetical protein